MGFDTISEHVTVGDVISINDVSTEAANHDLFS